MAYLDRLLGFSVLLLGAVIVNGQEASGPIPKSSLSRDVRQAVDSARGAPPEFAADALLTLIESGFVGDRKLQSGLIEEAYNLAVGAEQKVGLEWPGSEPVGAAATWIYWKGIDQVSLRARAAKAMLRVDNSAARDLYERIPLPLDETSSCEKAPYAKLAIYYSVLPGVWESIGSVPDRSNFLTAQIARVRSIAQIRPMADALVTISQKGRGEDMAPLYYLFASRLPKLDHDSRIFSAEARPVIVSLERLANAIGPGAREFLIQQAREWVLQASRRGICTDRAYRMMSHEGKISTVPPAVPIELFNSELAPLASSNPKIDPQAAHSALPGAVWERGEFSADYLRLDQMRRLLERDITEEKLTPRWSVEVEKYITLLSEWKETASSDRDSTPFYLEKADLLHRALALKEEPEEDGVKPGDFRYWESRRVAPQAKYMGRDRALVALVNLFEGGTAAAVYDRHRFLWFAPMRQLVGSAENNDALDDLLIGSKDPVLHLYGLLGRLHRRAGHTSF